MGDVNIRLNMLDSVFQRVVDVTINKFEENDLEDCFGPDTKAQFGNIMNRFFLNMLAKTKNSMQASFKDICLQTDVEDRLSILTTEENERQQKLDSDNALSQDSNKTTHGFKQIIREIKLAEKEELTNAINKLQNDVTRLDNIAGQYRKQLQNEIAKLDEEKRRYVASALRNH